MIDYLIFLSSSVGSSKINKHGKGSKNYQQLTNVSQRGFALLMVLVLIALASISLVGLARSSLQLSRMVSEKREDLQRRWGMASCQRMILHNPEDIFQAHYKSSNIESTVWPLQKDLIAEFVLGELEFRVQLSDESAKVNVNNIYRIRPKEIDGVVSVLSGGESDLIVNVRGSPENSQANEIQSFQSWGQIFDAPENLRASSVPRALCNMTDQLTCWGLGKLNIRRASDLAVRIVCESELDPETMRNLLLVRKKPGQSGLSAIVSQIAMTHKEESAIGRLLTDESRCYSLWTFCRGNLREWSSLTVSHPGSKSGVEKAVFFW